MLMANIREPFRDIPAHERDAGDIDGNAQRLIAAFEPAALNVAYGS